MDTRFSSNFGGRSASISPTHQIAISRFISKTYGWMTLGLLLTAVMSFVVASSPAAVQFIFGNRWVFPVLMVGELLLVLGLTLSFSKLDSTTALLGFLFYAAVNGVTLSSIFLAYTAGSIAQVFMITAGMFGGLALFGTLTKKDLTPIGTFFAMGIWGLILLGLVNLFVHSESLSMGLSVAGVFVFAGLTAWDAQKIKMLAYQSVTGGGARAEADKGAVFGALMLYLDFINLFLSLLRLFGSRRD